MQDKPVLSHVPKGIHNTMTHSLGDSSALTREQVEAALPEMEKYVTHVMEDTGVPGMAIVVVFQDEVVYLKGFGVRETGKDAPVDGNTVFQLASLSKPIASTLVA